MNKLCSRNFQSKKLCMGVQDHVLVHDDLCELVKGFPETLWIYREKLPRVCIICTDIKDNAI